MKKIASIILAAGFSSRMGQFKPVLPVGDKTLVAHVIDMYRTAGIADIRVVVGHHAECLYPVLHSLGVATVENQKYEDGMFSSVQAGIRSLGEAHQGFFVHPVDVPLVQPQTIHHLLTRFHEDSDRILYPACQGRRGHPPFISAVFADSILNWNGRNGLKGALSELEEKARDVIVEDEGILFDMDTEVDYRFIAERLSKPQCAGGRLHLPQ